MGPADLHELLKPLAASSERDPRLLVGSETADDAAVFRLDDRTALVQTLDIITPIVDDPFDFGYIAAVNALSDVYAMGGTPLTALTFLAFDTCDLDITGAGYILIGALAALAEARCALIGGHTVMDPEIKFGLSVTGTVHPDRVLTNAGARDGDLIYLTKPLGTGITATALKAQLAPDELVEKATGWMKTPNREAAA
ncbi:MAG: selenide, water dikinase SelD, partial [bacterium]